MARGALAGHARLRTMSALVRSFCLYMPPLCSFCQLCCRCFVKYCWSSLRRLPRMAARAPSPARAGLAEMLVLTTPLATHGSQSTFVCTSTGALLKRRPGREEAWPARRCPRLSAGPGERRRGLSADQLEATITAARLEPFHQCLALFLRGLFANGGSQL